MHGAYANITIQTASRNNTTLTASRSITIQKASRSNTTLTAVCACVCAGYNGIASRRIGRCGVKQAATYRWSVISVNKSRQTDTMSETPSTMLSCIMHHVSTPSRHTSHRSHGHAGIDRQAQTDSQLSGLIVSKSCQIWLYYMYYISHSALIKENQIAQAVCVLGNCCRAPNQPRTLCGTLQRTARTVLCMACTAHDLHISTPKSKDPRMNIHWNKARSALVIKTWVMYLVENKPEKPWVEWPRRLCAMALGMEQNNQHTHVRCYAAMNRSRRDNSKTASLCARESNAPKSGPVKAPP